ncbi:MAG: ABC transporter substrate-binding protein [Chloroflexota bacterium]
MARSATIKDFNGVNHFMGHYAYIRSLYDTLIRLDENGEPQPELAESWQFSPDGLAMTLKLRQGVKFHSGNDFTSEDFKASWEFAKDPKTASQLRVLFSLIADVKTPDKYTVELNFEKPNPLVFDALDTLCAFDKTGIANLAKSDAGAGPFTIKSYTPNGDLQLERFAQYWRQDRPYVDEYVIRMIPDASALVLNLESNAVDAVWAPALHEVERLKTAPGYVADVGAFGSNMYHIEVNVRQGPLSNKKVRQAINHAIDRQRFCTTIMRGTSEPTCLMWPKGSWGYFSDLEGRYPYDLDKAKALLAEAGYADGFGTTIQASSQVNFAQGGLAQILQADLAKIGIKAKIDDIESALYNSKHLKGDFELRVHNYGRANRDPGSMLAGARVFVPASEEGPIGFESADFLKWRDEAASTLDKEKRKALYRQIQELFLDESFSMPVAPQQNYWLYRDYVKDLKFTRENSPFVGDLWLDK